MHLEIGNHIRNNNGSCEVFPAPFAVFLQAEDEKNNTNYLEPDISVICDKDKLDSKGCNGAPDWIIEIVSPFSRQMDYYKKLALYQEAGVREYWIVDPAREIIVVYDFPNETPPRHDLRHYMNQLTVCLQDGNISAALQYLKHFDELCKESTVRYYCKKAIVFDENHFPLSQNPGHGIGTRSIIAFAQKNNAALDYQIEDGFFRLRILFPPTHAAEASQ